MKEKTLLFENCANVLIRDEKRICGYVLTYTLLEGTEREYKNNYYLDIVSNGIDFDSARVSLGCDEVRAMDIYRKICEGYVFPSTVDDVLCDIVCAEIVLKT